MFRSKIFFIGLLGLMMASCSHKETVHGHYLKKDEIEKLEIGKSTKSDAQYILGTPSAADPFQDENWYYIGQTNKKKIFSIPEIIDRQITVLSFNSKDILVGIVELDYNDSKSIEMIQRKTNTAGRNPTFVQQFIGNFGRFRQQKQKEYEDNKKR